jgi:hypothetical protein
VSLDEAKRYAKTVGAEVVEASAATGKNVASIFEKVWRRRQRAPAPLTTLPGCHAHAGEASGQQVE